MIVLDEQLADPQIIRSIEQWYKGKVIIIGEARPQTRITDDVIPALLRRLKAPTSVTIDYEDFWRKIPANSVYCVICFKLTGKRSAEVPGALRAILSRPEWRSKRTPGHRDFRQCSSSCVLFREATAHWIGHLNETKLNESFLSGEIIRL
jgi:hypothetical protein